MADQHAGRNADSRSTAREPTPFVGQLSHRLELGASLLGLQEFEPTTPSSRSNLGGGGALLDTHLAFLPAPSLPLVATTRFPPPPRSRRWSRQPRLPGPQPAPPVRSPAGPARSPRPPTPQPAARLPPAVLPPAPGPLPPAPPAFPAPTPPCTPQSRSRNKTPHASLTPSQTMSDQRKSSDHVRLRYGFSDTHGPAMGLVENGSGRSSVNHSV